jgi:cell division protein FtsZ
MNSETNPPITSPTPASLRVKIFGVGTAGTVIVDQLSRVEFAPADFAFINTDSSAPSGPTKQLLLETKSLRGLGTGGDPERGRKLAEEHFEKLKAGCAGADVVFLIAGLGGGAGTGVSPVLAQAARDSGALVLAFVTLPFDCEGNRRQEQAQQGLEQLKHACDGVICLPNQKAFQLLDENASVADTFRATAQLLSEGVRGVWRLLIHRGFIEIHFEELCVVLRERHGESYFATLESAGAPRVSDLIGKIPSHPLLDGGQTLATAASVIVSILGGPDLTMAQINQVMQAVTAQCPQARVIMGAAMGENFRDRLAVTLITTRERKADAVKPSFDTLSDTEVSDLAAEFGAELLHPTRSERPTTRTVPPAPVLTGEQREAIISKHTGKASRTRKAGVGPRMRQTTLPLDIVNKGRFDKSEPTIHKGEDLDLPTYIRRGVALN